jgi:TolB protein
VLRQEVQWRMPDSETFDAFYARTVWNVTNQMHEMAGDDSTADHAIREAYAKAYQQWYQVSGYRDSEGWVLATAKDAYERRRAEAANLDQSPAAQANDSGTWPGFFRPAAQPGRGGGPGQTPADPEATVAAPRRNGAGDGAGAPGAVPAAWSYPAAGGNAGDATAGNGTPRGPAPTHDLAGGQSGRRGLVGGPARPGRGGPGRNGPGGGLSPLGDGGPSRLATRRNLIVAGVAVAALVIVGITYASGGGHNAPGPGASQGTTAKSPGKPKPHMLAAGRTGRRSAIPWPLVGSGWALAEYSAAQPQANGAAPSSGSQTTYLVDPAGGKYVIATSSGNTAPQLIAWSGDAKTALFGPAASNTAGAAAGYSLLHVATGQTTPLQLPPDVSAAGFTRPDGLNILAVRHKAGSFWLERYDLSGAFTGKMGSLPSKAGEIWPANGCGYGCALSSPDGLLDVWGIFGDEMHVLSNSGGKSRKLHVPDSHSCVPLSWWDDSTILADCVAAKLPDDATQLWLVPDNGSAPRPLTQPAAAGSGRIAGAWQAGSTVYVTSVTSRQCSGVPVQSAGLGISPASSSGPASPISIPGTTNNSSTVVATDGNRLLVLAQTSCPGTSSLSWFNPSAGTVTPVLEAPSSQAGVIAAVPYGNGPTALSAGQ